MSKMIYKIVSEPLWQIAKDKGVFEGAEIDLQDGYIHFSTATQAIETARKHFSGKSDLLLVALKDDQFGDALKYEVSRGGDLFPHLYGTFNVSDIAWVKPLPLDDAGEHIFPELL